MFTGRWIAATGPALLGLSGTLLGLSAVSAAQQQSPSPLAALRDAQLTVWVIQPAEPSPLSKALQIAALHHATPLTYQERDPGNFGQPASTVGVDANKYGEPATTSTISAPPDGTGYHEETTGNLGQPASTIGTDSNKIGEPTGSLGQNAASYGVDSNHYGQTTGSFGTSVSNIAQAGNPPANPPDSGAPKLSQQETDELHSFEQRVRSAFPELHVRYVSVDPGELRSRLAAARGTPHFPDVLILPGGTTASPPGTSPAAPSAAPSEAPSAAWWSSIQRNYGVALLQPAAFLADGVTQSQSATPQAILLSHAPDMAAAQALALWLSESGSGCDGCVFADLPDGVRSAAAVAAGAVMRMLHGDPVGIDADPRMTSIPPASLRLRFTGGASTLPPATPLRIETTHASVNGSLAIVTLRAIASSPTVFGVLHPLVVLRQAENGRWRVLYVALNLPPVQQEHERETLNDSLAVASNRDAAPKGISQASPPDGDTRSPQPILWWDNRGGATLQVIEWQADRSGGWADPHLYLAPDVGSTLRTQVTASFADTPATYRWRVWSIGGQGAIAISPWSTMRIVQ